ncbi:MAG TPA: ABC transporter substrate-binding protein [Methanotrichaceae archaeon]|nr:ABC transporter substrate-binding protein [Methanotrichaceae archaeon]HQF17575.1 ABC transporter substrate-binding protein [Methanotrichaceae archaeon]HQI92131.1 ABC transporter substrate-binding protein [Methanotrichaceae archaeon]
MSYQTPLGKIKRVFIATLLLQAALICTAIQATSAEENTMTIAIGDWAGIGTDPTLYVRAFPGVGTIQTHHQYTHLEPLITLDNKGNIIPWLAESYEVSDDNKAITFHLRKGIRFADGKPLNASVLKFNFDRFLTFGFVAAFGKNGTKSPLYVNYEHSDVADEYTLILHFTEGWLDMPRDIAFTRIYGNFIHPGDVDPAWDIKGTLKKEKSFNGLGPYYVDENESVSNQKIVLKRRHSWRDDYEFHKPRLDQIVLKLIKDPQVAVAALEKGEVDYISRYWNVPLDSLSGLEKNPAITIKTSPGSTMLYLTTAYWKEPFIGEDGILLRKAMCYALNRREMAEGAFRGYAKPATNSMLLSQLKPDCPECCLMGYYYDLDKAKELVARAGWSDKDGDGILDKNGKSLKNLDMVLTSDSGLAWQKELGAIVKTQFRMIGIDVNIRMVDPSIYYNLRNTGDYDLKMWYTSGGAISSAGDFGTTFNWKGPSGSSTDSINDYSNHNNSLAVAIDGAKSSNSRDRQEEYLCQACNILFEEAGTIPLLFEMQYAVMNSRIKGFQLGPSKSYTELDNVMECWAT